MKRLSLYSFVAALFLLSCQNSKKLLNSGNYDLAIDVATRKLIRDKQNDKQILTLEEAFKKDAERDNSRIIFLKQEGRPDSWNEIYLTYTHINKRQNVVKPLLPLFIKSQSRNANFEFTDVNADLIAAKQKAAEFDYAAAMQLLDKNTRADARNAYEKLMNVQYLYPAYKDVDGQLKRAYAMGISYVLFKMQNQSGIPLPPDFENELTKITLNELNRTWLQYDVRAVEGRKYDYNIWVNMKIIDVSPESVRENSYTESKEINDGFQYALDEKGNVKKDQAGNDIKVPKTRTIFCTVKEIHQLKKAIITGTLDYVNNASQQLIKSEPLVAENIFENHAARSEGNTDALKPESKAKLGSGPVPFPPSPAMILNAGQALKARVKDIIWANKNLLY
jgi:hypothetical protein